MPNLPETGVDNSRNPIAVPCCANANPETHNATNRRTFLSSAVALSASAVLPVSAAEVSAEGKTTIERRIAEYRKADAAHAIAWNRWIDLDTSLGLYNVHVIGGYYSERDLETDVVRRCPIKLFNHKDIDRHCNNSANPYLPHSIEIAEKMRARLHAELDQIELKNAEIRKSNGVDAALAEADRLLELRNAAMMAVLRPTPSSLEEYRIRDAFVLEFVKDGEFYLDDDELRALFSA